MLSNGLMGRVLTLCLGGMLLGTRLVEGYQVLVSDRDDVRQTCSGMWGPTKSKDPFIEVIFGPASKGQVALVIYEWEDAKYLGIDTKDRKEENQWEDDRVYVCTPSAVNNGLCTAENLGAFITTLPEGVQLSDTSIYTAPLTLGSSSSNTTTTTTPSPSFSSRQVIPGIRYDIKRTGYYCVGTVPVVPSAAEDATSTSFTGVVDFENVFDGHLPASEYPKVVFYFTLAIVYVFLGLAWGVSCWMNRRDLLAIQHYVSGTILFLIVEMFAIYGYYRYLNLGGNEAASRALLALVAILNAARNSISFFMLLIVSMGYGVVRPTLGPAMVRARILAAVHFFFGILYSIGVVAIPIESAGFLIFLFVFPLAFSLTAFMMWIMWSLNATIADLAARRQSFKKTMFTRLYRILMGAVLVIGAFFVISTMSFSSRLKADFAPDTWKTRWILSDGWLGVLYFAVFAAIAFLWRPTPNNRRLAMSDELATDEADAEDFEIDTLNHHRLAEEGGDKDEDEGRPLNRGGVGNDSVVFDIGDVDDDDEGSPRTPRPGHPDRPPSYRREPGEGGLKLVT